MNLLALDLGASCGWAMIKEGESMPLYGTKIFKGDLIDTAPAFYLWLTKVVIEHEISDIGIESVIMTKHFNHEEKVFSWRTAAFICAGVQKKKLWDVAVLEWRKYFLNGEKPPSGLESEERRKFWKKTARKICTERGWPTKTDDEAEALGVMDFIRACENPTYGISNAPLFQQPAF